MIRPIRAIATALQDEMSGVVPCTDSACPEHGDEDLDVLVRHAFRQEAVSHDAKHVWTRLSRRVRGPFGALAIEEPAMRGDTMPVISEAPSRDDSRPDSMRHSLFRTAEATFSMR
jgi:hypothetical protein